MNHALSVLICGCGIAGPTLAFWLERAGLRPTLVESARHPRTGGYMIDFWGAGFEVAARMGLEAQLRDAGYQIEEMQMLDSRGLFARRSQCLFQPYHRRPAGCLVHAA